MLQKNDLIGNLVADAEIMTGKDGSEFIAFRVAASESSGEEKRTTYYEVSCHKSGVIDYLKKGQQVYVSGRLSISANCKDGKAYLNAYVSANHVILCSGPRN